MPTDVVLTFFSTPSPKQADPSMVQPVSAFADPPRVFPDPGGIDPTGQDTHRWDSVVTAMRNPQTGRILPKLLAATGVSDIGRVAVVTFSAGRRMASEILLHEDDRVAVDAVIDIDGLNLMKTPNGQPDWGMNRFALGPWVEYGKLALTSQRLLVNQHTDIAGPTPQHYSTTEACALLYGALEEEHSWVHTVADQVFCSQPVNLKELQAGPPPPTATVYGQSGDKTRTWDAMPPLDVKSVGNCHKIHLAGNAAGHHIFSCYYVQPAIWRAFLAPRWGAKGPSDVRSLITADWWTDLTDSIFGPPDPADFDNFVPPPPETTYVNMADIQSDLAQDPTYTPDMTGAILKPLALIAGGAAAFYAVDWAYRRYWK